MAQKNNITIKFKSSGAPALKAAITALANEQERLNGKFKGYVKGAEQGTRGNGLFGKSFATLRSHMLLFNFAMALGIRQITAFAKDAAKVNSMERAFNTMAGATENSSTAFKRLQEATNGTMSKFDLFQQANNAMILGVSQSSEEMALMFDMAQRLGNALGRDTKSSVESLITGIGRQSRLMLDNIGIMVKTEEAYKSYAKELETTADQLTDSERKQAFLNATLEAATQKVALLPPEVMNAQMAFDKFGASADNAGAEIGDAFIPVLKSASLAASFLLDKLDADSIQRFAVSLGVGTLAFMGFKLAATLAAAETLKLNAALMANPFGAVAVIATTLTMTLLSYFEVFKGGAEDVDSFRHAQEKAEEAAIALTKAQEDGEKSLQLQLDLLNATSEIQKMIIEQTSERAGGADSLTAKEGVLIQKIIEKKEALEAEEKAQKAIKNALVASSKEREKEKSIFSAANSLFNESILLQMQLNGADEKSIKLKELQVEAANALNKVKEGTVDIDATDLANVSLAISTKGDLTIAERAYIKALQEVIDKKLQLILLGDAGDDGTKKEIEQLATLQDVYSETYTAIADLVNTNQQKIISSQKQAANNEISDLKKTRKFRMADSATQKKMEQDIRDEKNKEIKKAFRVQQLAQIGQVWMNIALSASRQFADMPLPAALMAQPLLLAVGGIQSAAIMAQKPPTMEQGGMIGGRRHSQGGTMIEAERGEFVMSRNAVDSVGLEAMNRINSGGGSGAVSINFTGNVMSQDFIEDEAIPMIKEAIRRGADIGVA